ncbi:haloacid dehalogenase type II [Chryseobacterium sp. CT-SW4]|uniref:haloacid dehalogenase type II n=1 Tax=Chryseobacterium sp. SW-1 TaxID=3157343 RepID=UPI003B01441C
MDNLQTNSQPKVLFFDINETLLNTAAIQSLLSESFGEDVYDLWFSKLLHYSLVSTVTETYKSFKLIASDALQVVSQLKKREIPQNISAKLADTLSELPAHPEVAESLKMLKEKGYLIVALSNSSQDLLRKQLDNAHIDHLFDEQISVEAFQKYKPHTEVYHKAASFLHIPKEECMLIAAHDWDVYGALSAGLRAAFINRKGQCPYFLPVKPELEETDLLSLAKKL